MENASERGNCVALLSRRRRDSSVVREGVLLCPVLDLSGMHYGFARPFARGSDRGKRRRRFICRIF